jgi:carboxypeptidase family protein
MIASGALSATASAASAQSVLTGTVREDSTGRPLSGVEVSVDGVRQTTRTDSAGKFAITVPSGSPTATFRLLGYQASKQRFIARRDTVHADVSLVRAAANELPAVQVQAANRTASLGRDGIAARRALGFGKFIDSTALRSREGRQLSDVLRELTGVRMLEFRDPNSGVVRVQAISPISGPTQTQQYVNGIARGAPPCYVSVFLDNVSLYRSDRTGGTGEPPDLSRDVLVSSLESVEYYRGASEVPQEFGGSAANCGALVLWTRR